MILQKWGVKILENSQWYSIPCCELKRDGQKCTILHFRKSIFGFCMKSTFKYIEDSAPSKVHQNYLK
jgi:hypothetical protein